MIYDSKINSNFSVPTKISTIINKHKHTNTHIVHIYRVISQRKWRPGNISYFHNSLIFEFSVTMHGIIDRYILLVPGNVDTIAYKSQLLWYVYKITVFTLFIYISSNNMLCAFIINLDGLDLSTHAIICSLWLVWLTRSFFLSQICQIEWMNRPTIPITQNPHWCTDILYELYLDHVIPRSFYTMPFMLYHTARLHPNWTTSRRIHISSWSICHPSIHHSAILVLQ